MTLLAVMAMARPRRPAHEAALVRDLTASMGGSVRARATRAARMVAAEAVAYLDTDPEDPTDQLIAAVRSLAPVSPARRLATCPDLDTVALVLAGRTRRFQARGGRQLGADAWRRESEEVAAETAAILAERYRDHLRK